MKSPTKGKPMTNAEEVRELRRWLREESTNRAELYRDLHRKIDDGNRHLHSKMDACNLENQEQHRILTKSIADITTDEKVSRTKIVALASLVSLIVSGIVLAGFNHLANGA